MQWFSYPAQSLPLNQRKSRLINFVAETDVCFGRAKPSSTQIHHSLHMSNISVLKGVIRNTPKYYDVPQNACFSVRCALGFLRIA